MTASKLMIKKYSVLMRFTTNFSTIWMRLYYSYGHTDLLASCRCWFFCSTITNNNTVVVLHFYLEIEVFRCWNYDGSTTVDVDGEIQSQPIYRSHPIPTCFQWSFLSKGDPAYLCFHEGPSYTHPFPQTLQRTSSETRRSVSPCLGPPHKKSKGEE